MYATKIDVMRGALVYTDEGSEQRLECRNLKSSSIIITTAVDTYRLTELNDVEQMNPDD